MIEAFLVDGVRTPIGNHAGCLAHVRPDDLAATVIRELLKRHPGLDPTRIDDVLLGCANQAGEDNRNVARMAGLLAGLPTSVPGQTVNRLCASGLAAAVDAARAIQVGAAEIMLAGGVESMTRAPFVLSKASAPFSRSAEFFDTSLGWRFVNPKMKEHFGVDSMGETAENVATEHKISRDDQDRFALFSQTKAARSKESARFEREIIAVEVPDGKATKHVSTDEFMRPQTTLESLAKIKPAFRSGGTVTAGNSSGINDGACALLLASAKACAEFKLKPLARLVGAAVAGVEPRVMGIGPVPAIQKLLQQTGVSLNKIGVIELNEAFAAQSLACLRALEIADADPRVNPNGGAIALGHPLGMTGARLALSACIELHLRHQQYALTSMCIGVGQGMAALWERVE